MAESARIGLGGATIPVATGGTAAQVAAGVQAPINAAVGALNTAPVNGAALAGQDVGGPTGAAGGTNGDTSSTGTGGTARTDQDAGNGIGGDARAGNTTGGSAHSSATANAGGNQSNSTSTKGAASLFASRSTSGCEPKKAALTRISAISPLSGCCSRVAKFQFNTAWGQRGWRL